MSVLGAICLDVVENMRQLTKGWVVQPLVIYNEQNRPDSIGISHLMVLTVPNDVSPTQHYHAHPPENWTAISIKVPHQKPRIILLHLEHASVPIIRIAYYIANGWKQNQASYKRFSRLSNIPTPDGCITFQLARLYRVHRRNRRRKPLIKYHDFIDITDALSAKRAIDVFVEVVKLSFDATGKDQNFKLGIDIQDQRIIRIAFDRVNFESVENRL